jgi:metallo-beta-lactamase family protein
MAVPILTFHGASQTVTGSCYQLTVGGRELLVDCGLFQGSRSLEALNLKPFAFEAAKVDAVLITHAHLDHSGLLPRLSANGFRGTTWCTAATGELLEVMLPDAARIQEQDAERRNRRADRADEPHVPPLYTSADADRVLASIRAIDLEEDFEPAPGVTSRLWNAGHILGSASVEVRAGGVRTLFSGDLGPEHKAFHADPEGPHQIDHLLCEGTYGDREREDLTIEQRRSLLEEEVRAALRRGGNLVIPVFALERTQELLLDLACLLEGDRIPRTQVFIDSPLAGRVTEVFRRHADELEDMDCGPIFDNAAFHYVETADQSMRLNSLSGAIILSASGMCEAGRIRHHLRHNLPRPDSTILFVGFQAQGSLGRTIMEGAKRVRISGRDVAVRAQVRRIENYSAHADRSDLMAWARERQPVAGSLFLTHGVTGALTSLREALEPYLHSVIVPEIGERYELAAGAPAKRLTTGRVDLRPVLNRDWQNDYADFTVNLRRELQSIQSAEKRAEALALMRRVLDDYASSRERRRTRSDA